MKTILYFFMVILVFGIMSAGYSNGGNEKAIILIQSKDAQIPSAILFQSAEIITNRLRDFGSEVFDISVIPEKNQIRVTLAQDRDLKTVEDLITHKGRFEFFETCDQRSITRLLKGDDHLYSLLARSDSNVSLPVIGCTSVSEVQKVNDYIQSLDPGQGCKFAWSQPAGSNEACLYALRSDSEKGALLTGKHIDSIIFSQEKATGDYYLEIRFRKDAVELWSEATACNIKKSIAVVLDEKVILAPRVNEVINDGRCQISGDFSPEQVSFISALGNNAELPAAFSVVE